MSIITIACCQQLFAVRDGGVGERTALSRLCRRGAGGFGLLLAYDSVDFHLVGHGGGDGVRVVGVVVQRWRRVVAGRSR